MPSPPYWRNHVSGLNVFYSMNTILAKPPNQPLYRTALALAVLTIVYNLLEGFISTYLGYEDESLTLFGFGLDSFIEVVSGLGVANMVRRMQLNPASNRAPFERTALRITGTRFYVLVGGLLLTSGYNLWAGHHPTTTFWGVVVALVSIATMGLLIWAKTNVGRQLNSAAILADAECTRVCLYMSLILLASSGLYEWTHIAYADVAGTLGLSFYALREGQECFEKARSETHCGCHSG